MAPLRSGDCNQFLPNDAKSITALNLASTMAHAGSRVLLIDADLRRGNLHKRLGVQAQPGLFQVLGLVFNAVRASIGENHYYYHYRDYYQGFPSR